MNCFDFTILLHFHFKIIMNMFKILNIKLNKNLLI